MDLVNDVWTTKLITHATRVHKVRQILSYFSPFVDQSSPNYTCAEQIAVCNAASIQQHFVSFWRYSRSSCEVVQHVQQFWCLWAQIMGKFLTQFYKFGSPLNTCRNMVTIDWAILEIRRWEKSKKKEINDSGDTEALCSSALMMRGSNNNDNINNSNKTSMCNKQINELTKNSE